MVKTVCRPVDILAVLIGWFTRLLVLFAAVGVFCIDGVALVSAHLSAQQDANDAASSAAVAWQNDHLAPGAVAAAETAAETALHHDEAIVPGTFQIATDGSVTLRLHRVAGRTVLAHDIGFLKQLVIFDVTGSAPAPSA